MSLTPRNRYLPAAARVLLAMTFAACIAAPVLAQEPVPPPPPQAGPEGPGGPHGDMRGHQLEHLTKALNLTPDQVTQVKAIQADSRQQMMAARQDSTTAGADRHTRMMAIHQAEQTKIRALLNSDQQTKFDAMQARMQERQQERGQHQGNEPPPPPPPPSI